jgi:hypothetical protein
MIKKKVLIPVFLGLLIVFGALAIFFVPSFFVDEFSYVYVNYSTNEMIITTNPNDLFEKTISRWTDVSATFKNDSQRECIVVLKSDSLNQSFNVASGSEYGVILPKGEDISILFCGAQREIRLN